MKHRPTAVWVLGLCAGVSLGAAVGALPQSGKPSLAGFAEEKIQVSKMDWVLLNARINTLAWTLFRNFKIPAIPMNFRYEPKTNRIISNSLVNPDWLANANLDEAKKTLSSNAVSFCAEGPMISMTSLPDQEGLQFLVFGEEFRSVCTVEFYTFGIDKSGKLERKEVATYEKDQLILK